MSGVVRYKHENADRHVGLELPDGRPVATVRLPELRLQLRRLGIEINEEMGKGQLLDCYAARLETIAAELRPPNTRVILPLPQEMMRSAVAFIEKQAST
jgi:hypothetical protein